MTFTVHDAVRELRSELGLSQQAFANMLNLSVRAVANYENRRIPTPKVLASLTELACKRGLHQAAEAFRRAFEETCGGPMSQRKSGPVKNILSDSRVRCNPEQLIAAKELIQAFLYAITTQPQERDFNLAIVLRVGALLRGEAKVAEVRDDQIVEALIAAELAEKEFHAGLLGKN